MPFAKGHKRVGGRRKGVPGIVTAGFSAAEACRARGVDPFALLAEMVACENWEFARPAAETLCRYLQPQLRQMEVQVRRTPEQIVVELMANPELRQRVVELFEQAAHERLPQAERELIVASPSVQ